MGCAYKHPMGYPTIDFHQARLLTDFRVCI